MNDPKESDNRTGANDHDQLEPAPHWVKILGGVLVALLLVFIATHLAGGGFRSHSP